MKSCIGRKNRCAVRFGRRIFAYCGRSWIWNGAFKCRRFGRAATASVATVGVLVIRGDRHGSHRPKRQFGGEKFVADPPLRLKRSTVATASRTCDRATQQAHRLGGDSQIEIEAASGIVTGGAINDAAFGGSVAGFFVSRSRGLHFGYLPSWGASLRLLSQSTAFSHRYRRKNRAKVSSNPCASMPFSWRC